MVTKLEIDDAMRNTVIEFVRQQGSIKNHQCRELLGIDYDQAITLFNSMIESGHLVRVGKTAATRYILPNTEMG